GHVEDLVAALPQTFEVRAAAARLETVAGDVVDARLVRGHAGDVVVQRGELLAVRTRIAQEPGDLLPVVGLEVQALLQHAPEFAPEPRIAIALPVRLDLAL